MCFCRNALPRSFQPPTAGWVLVFSALDLVVKLFNDMKVLLVGFPLMLYQHMKHISKILQRKADHKGYAENRNV
jgi:hypothetical protein